MKKGYYDPEGNRQVFYNKYPDKLDNTISSVLHLSALTVFPSSLQISEQESTVEGENV